MENKDVAFGDMMSVEDGEESVGEGADLFSVMTWNVLADVYAGKTMSNAGRGSEQQKALEPLYWSRRGPLLRSFLTDKQPDILCMQEVDHHHDFFAPLLSQLGYSGSYAPRPYKREGCSTFWKTNKFQLAKKVVVDYNQLKSRYVPGTKTGNLGLITFLVPAEGSDVSIPIIVANTHLTWKPTRNDLRTVQVHTLMSAIATLVKEELKEWKECGVVVCGDFNMCPEGVVYEYITKGCVEEERWRAALREGESNPGRNASKERTAAKSAPRGRGRGGRGGGSKPAPQHTQHKGNNESGGEGGRTTVSVEHQLKFRSGYDSYTSDRGEPHFTNYTEDFKDCLDYIFYSPDCLRLVQRMRLPSDGDLQDLKSLPNGTHPSDHLPLMCSFRHQRVTSNELDSRF